MKEVIEEIVLQQAKELVRDMNADIATNPEGVHCSWCANCSGIVGD